MARISDPQLLPKVEPSVATRAQMRALADRIRVEGMIHVNSMRATLELLVEELEAGRGEAVMPCEVDLSESITELMRFTAIVQTVFNTVRELDPAYHLALQPVQRETMIRISLRALLQVSLAELRIVQASHDKACSNPNTCQVHEALRRAIAEKAGAP
jgi:transcription termination factor NusB